MGAKEFIPFVVLRPRHAIRTAEVAPIHDRYPQVPDRTTQRIPRRAQAAQAVQGDDDFGFSHGSCHLWGRWTPKASVACTGISATSGAGALRSLWDTCSALEAIPQTRRYRPAR